MSDQLITINNQSSVFAEWLKRLKDEGKTDEEIGQLLAGVAKLSALDIYAALMTSLTEEDMKEVESEVKETKSKSSDNESLPDY